MAGRQSDRKPLTRPEQGKASEWLSNWGFERGFGSLSFLPAAFARAASDARRTQVFGYFVGVVAEATVV